MGIQFPVKVGHKLSNPRLGSGLLVAELVGVEPWRHQWYSEIDPAYGLSQAAMINSLVDQYLSGWKMTRADVAAWHP